MFSPVNMASRRDLGASSNISLEPAPFGSDKAVTLTTTTSTAFRSRSPLKFWQACSNRINNLPSVSNRLDALRSY